MHRPGPLKKQLGSPALFGIVQGFIAASIYFSTGLVAERALGLTWAVFLAGAVLFAVIVPCYVEGASLHQERGGATVIARYAFNELVSFIAGWAICLDYLILVALCAFASTDYLGVFVYILYRRRQGLDLTSTHKVAIAQPVVDHEAEYDSVLVPLSEGYNETVIATAAKLAARRSSTRSSPYRAR